MTNCLMALGYIAFGVLLVSLVAMVVGACAGDVVFVFGLLGTVVSSVTMAAAGILLEWTDD